MSATQYQPIPPTKYLPHSAFPYPALTSRSEIIDLVAAYYGQDPARRGVNGNVGCMYHADTSPLGDTYCAVGIFVEDTDEIEDTDAGQNVSNWVCTNLEDVLMEQFRGHPLRFWQDLQLFHDKHEHFNEVTGLTKEGEQTVKDLHDTWD